MHYDTSTVHYTVLARHALRRQYTVLLEQPAQQSKLRHLYKLSVYTEVPHILDLTLVLSHNYYVLSTLWTLSSKLLQVGYTIDISQDKLQNVQTSCYYMHPCIGYSFKIRQNLTSVMHEPIRLSCNVNETFQNHMDYVRWFTTQGGRK